MLLKKEFTEIVRDAWRDYDGESRLVKSISDISAKVSTNHVFMIELENDEKVAEIYKMVSQHIIDYYS